MAAAWSGLTDGSILRVLLAVVARSPIVWQPVPAYAARRAQWAAARKAGNADAFVLAWIASHVRGQRRPPRVLN